MTQRRLRDDATQKRCWENVFVEKYDFMTHHGLFMVGDKDGTFGVRPDTI